MPFREGCGALAFEGLVSAFVPSLSRFSEKGVFCRSVVVCLAQQEVAADQNYLEADSSLRSSTTFPLILSF